MPQNPILRKLRITGGQRLAVLGAPEAYRPVLAELPEGTVLTEALDGESDVIHCFAANSAALSALAPALRAAMGPQTILWVSYPKDGQLQTDLKRDVVWPLLAAHGLRPVAQVSVDGVWSALRFKLA